MLAVRSKLNYNNIVKLHAIKPDESIEDWDREF